MSESRLLKLVRLKKVLCWYRPLNVGMVGAWRSKIEHIEQL
jgi:hypothetical protein